MAVTKISSSGLVRTGFAVISSVVLVPGSADASIVLNDSVDGTGDDKGACTSTTGFSNSTELCDADFQTGVYATLSGTGAVAYIYFE